jgi:hypothetical protein
VALCGLQVGIPRDGMQLSEGRALLQRRHLRDLSSRIDSQRDDEARRRGTAIRPAFASKEIARIEHAIRTKEQALKRHHH